MAKEKEVFEEEYNLIKQFKWLHKVKKSLVPVSKLANKNVYGTYIGVRVNDLIESIEQSIRDVYVEMDDKA